MGPKAAFLARFSSQLGAPTGLVGRMIIAPMLNRRNHTVIAAAADALALKDGDTAADIGFGGGAGLAALLDRVGPTGRVHGVDPSPTMKSRAESRYRKETRLHLHLGAITALPLDDIRAAAKARAVAAPRPS